MSRINSKSSVRTLLGGRQGISTRADIEWERIMVQITFAFVIILGYLISVEMHESRQLAAESAKYRRQNAALQTIVASFRGSEAGEERAQRLVAERELQLQRLLNAWARIRIGRELYQGLMQFRHAELVPLSDDLESLPVGEDFGLLKDEVERVFMSGKGKVSADEVAALVTDVLVEAGFDPRSIEDIAAEVELPPDATELRLDERIPTKENRRTLTLQIAGDLAQEREDLQEIQYALVGKIASARLEKYIELPLDAVEQIDVDLPGLGPRMLEQILSDLRSTMKLLPETAARIRGSNETESAVGQP